MKKFLAIILSLSLVFSLTACNKETKNADSSKDDEQQVASKDDVVVSWENKSDNENEDFSSGSTQPNNTDNNITPSTPNNSSQGGTGTSSDNNINQSTQNNSSQSNTQTPSKDNTTSNNTQSTPNNSSQSGTGTSSDNNINQSTQNNASQGTKDPSSDDTVKDDETTSLNIDNGVLEKATAQKMSVPENMKLLSTDNAKEENNSDTIKATAALYQLDGNVVNWTTENDLIYVITSGNNRLVVINSKTMMAVSNVPLAGAPAEINLVGDEIYISLPDLCRIDVFSKSSFAKTSSLYFDHEVSSFCIDGNYIYYSSHDQHCEAYKKDMTTNELTKILPDSGGSFYQPKLYLNKQDNILYIGETGSTGSTLFYYDATTLQLKSLFRKNDYGIMNHTRDIFHIGNDIFWGNYRFSDTDAKQIVGRYGTASYGSVNFASKELVSTFEGIFLADTYECIVNYFDAGFEFEYILVTESYNIFFRTRSFDKNIIVGVNFSMQ